MKQFLEMVEFARTHRIASHNPESIEKGENVSNFEQAEFFKFVEVCQPFVFNLTGKIPEELDSAMLDSNGKMIEVKMDAPFKVLSIEVLDGYITIPKHTDEHKIFIKCIISVEYKPRTFMHYVFSETFYGINGRKHIFVSPFFDGIVSKFIDRINTESLGTENVREKIKIGTGNTKRFHTVRRIIHVRPKRDQTMTNIITSRGIDWSHRWLVRGHWRTITGLGKDRAGDYCVHNNTWVTEHAKGNPELPLINKTRILEK